MGGMVSRNTKMLPANSPGKPPSDANSRQPFDRNRGDRYKAYTVFEQDLRVRAHLSQKSHAVGIV